MWEGLRLGAARCCNSMRKPFRRQRVREYPFSEYYSRKCNTISGQVEGTAFGDVILAFIKFLFPMEVSVCVSIALPKHF